MLQLQSCKCYTGTTCSKLKGSSISINVPHLGVLATITPHDPEKVLGSSTIYINSKKIKVLVDVKIPASSLSWFILV